MKLLFENWRSYLNELENVSDIDLPKKFYISIYFDDAMRPEIMQNLADNKVVKIPGQSSSDIVGSADNPSNFMQMHGNIRDATIVMNAKDFAEINNSIVKIEYDNPNFLTQDGLKALYRLMEKNQDSSIHAERVLRSIFDQADVGGTMSKVTRKEVDNRALYAMQNFLSDWTVQEALSKQLYDNLERVNSLDHLTDLLLPALQEQLKKVEAWRREELQEYISKDFLRVILYTGIVKSAQSYEEENEWVVDSNVLNVPKSSILYIAGPAVKAKEIFNKMKRGELTAAQKDMLSYEINKMDKIMASIKKYDLENNFKKVIITDMGTFNAAKNKWQKRKREMELTESGLPPGMEGFGFDVEDEESDPDGDALAALDQGDEFTIGRSKQIYRVINKAKNAYIKHVIKIDTKRRNSYIVKRVNPEGSIVAPFKVIKADGTAEKKPAAPAGLITKVGHTEARDW
jgi:DNA-binding protein YbaB